MKRTLFFIELIILLLTPIRAFAGQTSQSHSEMFGHVHSIAVGASGKALLLGTHNGLFQSDDGGSSWMKLALAAKFPHLDVMAVNLHPHDPKTLFAATHDIGVLKSSDGGKSWIEINKGLKGLDAHGLAIDAAMPSKLYVAIREKGEGIYRSIDGGGSWVRVDDGPGSEIKVLTSVNLPSGMGGILLYAGTAEGLQLSPDCF